MENCPESNCSGKLDLCKATITIEGVTIVDVPVLVCCDCNRRILTNEVMNSLKGMISDAKIDEMKIKTQVAQFFEFIEKRKRKNENS